MVYFISEHCVVREFGDELLSQKSQAGKKAAVEKLANNNIITQEIQEPKQTNKIDPTFLNPRKVNDFAYGHIFSVVTIALLITHKTPIMCH